MAALPYRWEAARRRPPRAGWLGAALLSCSSALLAQPGPGADRLPEAEYRTELEEVIVEGRRAPAWRDRQEAGPRWDRPQLEIPEPEPPRLQWLPEYTREERVQYDGVRDRRAAEPRLRVFELKF